ncbi:MAG TPA: hypothetical protein VIM56_03765 [Rhizomicrobium sp.]
MDIVTAFLAKKAGALLACALAIAAIIAVPAALYLDVELNGLTVPLVGWHLIDGARKERDDAIAARDAALRNYAQCQANEKTLTAEIADTNKRLKALSDEDAKRLKDAAAQLAAAQKQTAAALAKLKAIMAAPPAGKDLGARVQDVDHRFLETLP